MAGLEALGYSRLESEFLYLVAMHSGYFTHRQFLDFTGSKPGRASHHFLKKLVLMRKHANTRTFHNGGKLYHLFSKKIYGAMGCEHLPSRRRHELEYIKTRLVTVDFVLAHRSFRYLETEQQKVTFFEERLHIAREHMPSRTYGLKKTTEAKKRYFPDRFPIFWDPEAPHGGVGLTYVDFGSPTLAAFRSHLALWTPFLRALAGYDFLFLAPTNRLFKEAEAEFCRSLSGERLRFSAPDVMQYFELRKRWDTNQRVLSSEVLLLKKAFGQYAETIFEPLYQKWRTDALTEGELSKALAPRAATPGGAFRALVCGASLSIFADPQGRPEESSGRAVDEQLPVTVREA